jgi:hypothetical protein
VLSALNNKKDQQSVKGDYAEQKRGTTQDSCSYLFISNFFSPRNLRKVAKEKKKEALNFRVEK